MTRAAFNLRPSVDLQPGEPLHQRAPTHDEFGKPVSDFMMLLPGLKTAPQSELRQTAATLQAVLDDYKEVLFADLNVARNVLWVSVRPIPQIIPKIVGAIQKAVPEALVVGAPGVFR